MPPDTTDAMVFRLLASHDSIDELTELLHRAYKRLADMGLRFVATWQDAEITRKRVSRGECWVGVLDGRLVATAVLCFPPPAAEQVEWYNRPGVAMFQQYAVGPELQGSGVGSRLLRLLEDRARELGAEELALDTSEHAHHLIAFYRKRGYRDVGSTQWDAVNYRSVLMSKSLVTSADV